MLILNGSLLNARKYVFFVIALLIPFHLPFKAIMKASHRCIWVFVEEVKLERLCKPSPKGVYSHILRYLCCAFWKSGLKMNVDKL